jgi:hypothetical protein
MKAQMKAMKEAIMGAIMKKFYVRKKQQLTTPLKEFEIPFTNGQNESVKFIYYLFSIRI